MQHGQRTQLLTFPRRIGAGLITIGQGWMKERPAGRDSVVLVHGVLPSGGEQTPGRCGALARAGDASWHDGSWRGAFAVLVRGLPLAVARAGARLVHGVPVRVSPGVPTGGQGLLVHGVLFAPAQSDAAADMGAPGAWGSVCSRASGGCACCSVRHATKQEGNADARKSPQMDADGTGGSEAMQLARASTDMESSVPHAGPRPIRVHLRRFACICVSSFLRHRHGRRPGPASMGGRWPDGGGVFWCMGFWRGLRRVPRRAGKVGRCTGFCLLLRGQVRRRAWARLVHGVLCRFRPAPRRTAASSGAWGSVCPRAGAAPPGCSVRHATKQEGNADARKWPQMNADGTGGSEAGRLAGLRRTWSPWCHKRTQAHSRASAEICVHVRQPFLAASPWPPAPPGQHGWAAA
jgi:hypothetical protein